MTKLTGQQEKLFTDNLPLVRKVISDCVYLPKWQMNNERDDLEQIGRIALVRAAASFKETEGVRFSTYAYTSIRNALKDELKKKYRSTEIAVEEEAMLFGSLSGKVSSTDRYLTEEDKMVLLHYIESGARNKKERIGMIALLGRICGYNADECAGKMKVSKRDIYGCIKLGKERLHELLSEH